MASDSSKIVLNAIMWLFLLLLFGAISNQYYGIDSVIKIHKINLDEPEALNQLGKFAQSSSGLTIPDNNSKKLYDSMSVKVLTKNQIEEKICGGRGKCDGRNVAGYLHGGSVIYLPQSCSDWRSSVICQSKIVHEIVHLLQFINNKQKQVGDNYCNDMIRNEKQSLESQSKYLFSKGSIPGWSIDATIEQYRREC